MKKATFVDSGVLIAAARGEDQVARRAMEVLDDTRRTFISSDFVRLEVLPKAAYNRFDEEAEFYRAFFDSVETWAELDRVLVRRAFEAATEWGLSAVDALHVASAVSAGAEELVTSEKPQKPLFRVTSIRVRSIRGDA